MIFKTCPLCIFGCQTHQQRTIRKNNYVIQKGMKTYSESINLPSSFLLYIIHLFPPTQTSLTGASWQICGFWGRWTPRPGAGRGGVTLWWPGRSRGVSGRRRGLHEEPLSAAPHSLVSTGAPCWYQGTGWWDLGWGNAQGKPERHTEILCVKEFIKSCTNRTSGKV